MERGFHLARALILGVAMLTGRTLGEVAARGRTLPVMGCDPATLRFPKWPCFTILDPVGRSRELSSVQWPGRFGRVVIEDLHTDPPATVALTYHAPSVAKRFEITDEIRSICIVGGYCIWA